MFPPSVCCRTHPWWSACLDRGLIIFQRAAVLGLLQLCQNTRHSIPPMAYWGWGGGWTAGYQTMGSEGSSVCLWQMDKQANLWAKTHLTAADTVSKSGSSFSAFFLLVQLQDVWCLLAFQRIPMKDSQKIFFKNYKLSFKTSSISAGLKERNFTFK